MGKRIFTLLVGILIFVVVFGLDGLGLIHGAIFYNIAMAICCFLMCGEFYRAMEEKGHKPLKIIGYICVLFLIPIGVVKTYTMMLICAIGVPIVLFIGMLVTVGSRLKYNVVDVAITIFSVIYIVFLVAFLSTIRALPMRSVLSVLPNLWCVVF
jgi:phosphatidate cytidylyltransferase